MIEREPRLRTIIDINKRFLGAALVLFYGWLCWQATSPEWWGFGLIAIFCLIAGVVHLIATVVKIVALALRDRKINAFASQGGKVRADRMAGERDLKDRGMVR